MTAWGFNLFDRNKALTEVRRAFVRRPLMINGKVTRAVPEQRPQRKPVAKTQALCSTPSRTGIQGDVFGTKWDSTSFSVMVEGVTLSGLHCTTLATRYVAENQGMLGEAWKADVYVLKKVRDIDWVAFRCALKMLGGRGSSWIRTWRRHSSYAK